LFKTYLILFGRVDLYELFMKFLFTVNLIVGLKVNFFSS